MSVLVILTAVCLDPGSACYEMSNRSSAPNSISGREGREKKKQSKFRNLWHNRVI